MCENPNSAEDSDESARTAIELRVNRLMSTVKERTAHEMAEQVAGAMLLGKPLDEFYFEVLESMDGVEEAIHHIISSGQPRSGSVDSMALAAGTAVENLAVDLGDSVKRAAMSVRAREGNDFWACTRERIADLICAEMLPCPPAVGHMQREDERADSGGPEARREGPAPGPASYRRLGMVVLTQGNSGGDAVSDPASPRQVGRTAVGEKQQETLCADDHVLLGNEMAPKLAMAEYQKALALNPNHIMAHFFLAESFEAVGNPEAAKAEFLRVTQLAPNDPDAHWRLADILYDSGQPESAAAEYAHALSVAPRDEGIQQMYSLLDPWMKDHVRELTRRLLEEAQAVSVSTTSSPAVEPKKPVRLADLKKTSEDKFDLSGLTKNELADLLWDEAAKGEEE